MGDVTKALMVTNWDRWQTYRSDRGTPPWVKVHRKLLSNSEWAQLTDSEKGQLLSIWIVAADKDGEIPANPLVLRKVCQLDDEPNINKFIELGFLTEDDRQSGVKLASDCQPSDAPEERRKEERRGEESALCPHQKIIEMWNSLMPDYGFPKVVAGRWSGSKSEKHLATRWKENEAHRDLEFWKNLFGFVTSVEYWNGSNDRKWFADLHWCVKRDGFDKIIKRWANA